ncbi:MAG: UDP-2,3-diacylglucosamine diphosphatase LpxI [Aminobacteriaceae bacterium]
MSFVDPFSHPGTVAVIAGAGHLPVLAAERMSAAGTHVCVYSPIDDGRFSFLPEGHFFHMLSLPGAEGKLNLGALVFHMKSLGVSAVCLAGVVPKTLMYGVLEDPALRSILSGGANDDHSLLGRIVSALERSGFSVLSYADLVTDCIAVEGNIAGRTVTEKEMADAAYGKRILSVTLPLSFGQSVVVADGAVAAIEAMEGTDEMIRRAGSILSGAGGVVVKMMRPDQDERFDIPTVGAETLRNMAAAGLSCLAVEAGRTIIIHPGEFSSVARELSIAVEGISR